MPDAAREQFDIRLADARTVHPVRDDNGLVDFCQGLFNLNEFAFMP